MSNIILDFYGLSCQPFSKNIAEKDIFESRAHKEAIGMLELGVMSEDIMLLTGEIGIGKSVVLRSFMNSLDADSYVCLYLRGNCLSQTDLFKTILLELKIQPPHFANNARQEYYTRIEELGRKPVVIIDDSQDMKESALLGIKSMVNFDCDSRNKITFILAGQPELGQRIRMSHFYALRQRIKLALEMRKMSLEETCQYIDHHTRILNCPNPIFSDDVKLDIFKKSQGVARVINSLCYNALANGTINRITIIDSKNLVTSDLHDSL
jgi:type II secretory pathway predicted ATPase ExeA